MLEKPAKDHPVVQLGGCTGIDDHRGVVFKLFRRLSPHGTRERGAAYFRNGHVDYSSIILQYLHHLTYIRVPRLDKDRDTISTTAMPSPMPSNA
jgi:hypothetical protein